MIDVLSKIGNSGRQGKFTNPVDRIILDAQGVVLNNFKPNFSAFRQRRISLKYDRALRYDAAIYHDSFQPFRHYA